MNRNHLIERIKKRRSFLCVGLDSDPAKIPSFLHDYTDPVFEFNKRIIDATLPYTVAYKPNIAFYESSGSKGWISLEKTMQYLHQLPEKVFTIADAKRGDIGNSAAHYARAFFDHLGFDAVTVSPYMGQDSIAPFLNYEDKWTIILALTSNQGSEDFQVLQPQLPTLLDKLGMRSCGYWKKLYELVIDKALSWQKSDNVMFVVGATQTEMLATIREVAPDSFLLVPGVGAQGGDLKKVAEKLLNKDCGLLVNASRSIIFASHKEDFAQAAAAEAKKISTQMDQVLKNIF